MIGIARWLGLGVVAVVVTGCSAMLSSKLVNVVDTADFVGEPIDQITMACLPRGGHEAPLNRAAVVRNDAPLQINDGTPGDIARTETHRKLLALARFANVDAAGRAGITRGDAGASATSRVVLKVRNPGTVELTHAELIDYFLAILGKGLTVKAARHLHEQDAAHHGGPHAGYAWRRDPWEVWRRYYIAYANEGFVTRDGTELRRKEVARAIGNESIAALARIFLEGLFDAIYQTPVIVRGDHALDTGGRMPTAALLGVVDREPVLEEGPHSSRHCGITETEMRYMKAIGSLDGEATALLTKALGEMFGNFSISVGIGGHIKIGDADTVKTLIQVTSETVVQAQRRALLYHFFSKFSYRSAHGAGHAVTRGGPQSSIETDLPADARQAELLRSIAEGLESARAPSARGGRR